MSNKKYKLTDGNYWEASGIYDLGQNKTQREINSDLNTAITSNQNASLNWEQGSINSSGADFDISTRIRTGNFIDVSKADKINVSIASGYRGEVVHYNSSKTYISGSGWLTGNTSVTPLGTYIRIIASNTSNTDVIPQEGNNINVSLSEKAGDNIDSILSFLYPWAGKTIAWFGTSISACGYIGSKNSDAIPQKVGEAIHATVFNEAVGSSSVHCKDPDKINASTNPYGFMPDITQCSRCLTNTIEEMQWIIDHSTSNIWSNPTTFSSTEQQEILSFSYENRLNKYLSESTFPDLFIFEHGFNDNWNSKSIQDYWYGYHGMSEPYSYRAGMHKLIKLILNYNPHAKIMILGNYIAYGELNTNIGDTYRMQLEVADIFNIPIYKQWEFLGWSKESITTKGHWVQSGGTYAWADTNTDYTMTVRQAWLPDNVHPHSDPTGKAQAKMIAGIVRYLNNLATE